MQTIENHRLAFPKDQSLHEAIEEAIQWLVRKGLVFDTGERRWSERTGRYEIVWATVPVTRQ